MRKLIIALMLVIPAAAYALPGDVGCCKTCCHGSSCIMSHGPAHACVKVSPCK